MFNFSLIGTTLWILNFGYPTPSPPFLKSLMETYHLNGIEVDYQKFPKNNQSFPYCILELITLLKNQSMIAIAMIALFYNTVLPYTELFNGYGDAIDYVKHQFYTVEKFDIFV